MRNFARAARGAKKARKGRGGPGADGCKNGKCANGKTCFVAGTDIQTEDGSKDIEDIKAGDYVLAWDDEAGETVSREVVQTFERETHQLVTLETDQEKIVTTPEHPFWVEHLGYTEAGKLKVGDILITYNNQRVKVKAFRLRILARPVKVYNFEVKELHNYYAGTGGVLVHNSYLLKGEVKHIMNRHHKDTFAHQLKNLPKENIEGKLNSRTFFNPNWSKDEIVSATETGFNKFKNSPIGEYSINVKGEDITIITKVGKKNETRLRTAYGHHTLEYSDF